MEEFLTKWSSDVEPGMELESLEQKIELPYVLKDRRLIGPGVHNGFEYSSDSLKRIYSGSTWDKQSRALFFDHVDMSRGGGAQTWIGEVVNERIEEDGSVWGDLAILNKQAAINLEYGAKFGISAKVEGESDGEGNILDGIFANWSLVFVPADKSTYLNFEEKKMTDKIEVEQETVSLEEFNKLKAELKEQKDQVSGLVQKLEEATAEPEPEPAKEPEPEAPAPEAEPKPEDKPPEEKPKAEEAKAELSEDEFATIKAEEGFSDFAISHLQEHPEHTLLNAAVAWKDGARARAGEKQVGELQKKVEKLELQLEPTRKVIKTDGVVKEDVVAELSDKELDRGFAQYVLNNKTQGTW